MRRAALVALSAALAAGCASKADLQSLEASMLEEMRSGRAEQEALLGQLQAAIDSLEAVQARQKLTESGEFQRRVTRLQDQLDELFHLVSQNHQLLNDLYARAPGAGRSGLAGPEMGAAGAGEVEPATPEAGRGADSATQYYAAALQQYRQGNHDTARGAFEYFLATWPTHELAPDAQYYVAETYAAEGQDALALAEYQRVMELFPDSRRAPTSLYKRALIEKRNGNLAVARSLLRQIEAGYPNSQEAPLAREELAKLGG